MHESRAPEIFLASRYERFTVKRCVSKFHAGRTDRELPRPSRRRGMSHLLKCTLLFWGAGGTLNEDKYGASLHPLVEVKIYNVHFTAPPTNSKAQEFSIGQIDANVDATSQELVPGACFVRC